MIRKIYLLYKTASEVSKMALWGFLFCLLLTGISCTGEKRSFGRDQQEEAQPVDYDLEDIIDAGVLRVITTYSPTGYFLYKGKVMGFEYEIFKRLADHLGTSLEIVLAKNVDSVIPMLNRGEGDIIALGYTITTDRKENVSFTEPYLITHQSLIQRKPDNWRNMTLDNIKKKLATDVVDLIGDTVAVRKNSSYYLRLKELSNELGDSVYIDILHGELSDEQIIQMVSEGEIKYSIIDNHKAAIHSSYFSNIDVNTDRKSVV